MILAIPYIIFCNLTFRYVSFRLNPVLLHPTILLIINSISVIVINKEIQNSIPYYFNNNVDLTEPARWTIRKYEMLEAVFRVWHYVMYLKMFITTTSVFQIFTSPWVLAILT